MALPLQHRPLPQPPLPVHPLPVHPLQQAAHKQQALEQLRRQLAPTRPREWDHPTEAPEAGRWSGAALAGQLAGRLVELSSATGAGALTWAVRLAAALQRGGRPVAWVMTTGQGFYPPDAAANGLDLATLAVVRVPDATAVARAAERLTRCGGFALVVLELGARGVLSAALQGRLTQQALHHGTAVLCLTEKPERSASLGSLVSLRALAERCRVPQTPGGARAQGVPEADGVADGVAPPFACTLRIAKDKRGGVHPARWTYEETCHGPPGLR